MTITLKAGTGHGVPWITIDEPSVEGDRARILATFGWDESTQLPSGKKVSEISLAELTIAASNTLQGYESDASRNGFARVSGGNESSAAQPAKAKAEAPGKGSKGSEPEGTKVDDAEIERLILQAISEAKDKPEVQAIFVDNKDFIVPRKNIMDAMQERIKSFG